MSACGQPTKRAGRRWTWRPVRRGMRFYWSGRSTCLACCSAKLGLCAGRHGAWSPGGPQRVGSSALGLSRRRCSLWRSLRGCRRRWGSRLSPACGHRRQVLGGSAAGHIAALFQDSLLGPAFRPPFATYGPVPSSSSSRIRASDSPCSKTSPHDRRPGPKAGRRVAATPWPWDQRSNGHAPDS
jgi:hypothetical protein